MKRDEARTQVKENVFFLIIKTNKNHLEGEKHAGR